MNVPEDVREELRARLAAEAEKIGWQNLTWVEKSQKYEDWTRDPSIGGRLSRYIDRGQVRVYIKDTLVKPYTRSRLADHARPFRVLSIPADQEIAEFYRMPHGRRLMDGREIAWGRAAEWKTILMALHERAYLRATSRRHAVVLFEATGRYAQEEVREMVQDASTRLGIERLVWLET